MSASSGPQEVAFTLNGELFTVGLEEAASKTLNEYIRHKTEYVGTKVSCGQGGCGACTVAVARRGEKLRSVPSCLVPVASVHGAAVITVEGLTAADGKPHPVAERLAQFNGTQCGFCTPGMVMQLYSTLSQQGGGNACGEADLEQCINGNLCRCTGYRPIVECAKSFAAGSSVSNQLLPGGSSGPYDTTKDPVLTYPSDGPVLDTGRWLRPLTLSAALSALQGGAVAVAGATAAGVYPDLSIVGSKAKFVDITGVKELQEMVVVGSVLQIGACVTWNRFAEELAVLSAKTPNPQPLEELRGRCGAIAGDQVRNRGTIGGNISITRAKGFLSDWVPLLATLGAKVKVNGPGGRSTEEDLLAFVRAGTPVTGLIIAVTLPLPASGTVFRAFRVAKRSRNAHALVNAGFAAKLNGSALTDVSVVLGAADPKVTRLMTVEKALAGVTAQALQTNANAALAPVVQAAQADLGQLACTFGREQTEHVVCGFIVKFLTSLLPSAVPKEWASATYNLHDMPRKTVFNQHADATQDIGGALYKPMPKTTALDQTMGLSRFADDFPKPTRTLFGALVLCPEANVKVTQIDPSPAKSLLGASFYSIITAADLRENRFESSKFGSFGPGMPPAYVEDFDIDEYFLLAADQVSGFAGQPVALLLAHSDQPRLVERAATAVSEALRLERVGPTKVSGPLIGSEDRLTVEPLTLTKIQKQTVADLLKEAENKEGYAVVEGTFAKKSQAHFYMETQSCMVIPDESGFTCYVSCQTVNDVQKGIAWVTGLPQSSIVVKQRRVGGGFGGKAKKPMYMAALCALASQSTRQPIRLVLPRETDMQFVGGRQEMEGQWKAAVDVRTGAISALDYQVYLAHGVTEDTQKINGHLIGGAIDMCYAIPALQVDIHYVKQDLASRTAVRGPGHFEAVLLIEAVMDGVAAQLKTSGVAVREANFVQKQHYSSHTYGLSGGFMPPGKVEDDSHLALWDRVKDQVGYGQLSREVEEFNRANVWKKRGLAVSPARYGVARLSGHQARIDIFTDSSLQISSTGSEIGQGLHTKLCQATTTAFARELGFGPPMNIIRMCDQSTDQIPNGLLTGGSTSSELALFGCIQCAEKLANQLRKAAKMARKELPNGSNDELWKATISAAFSQKFLGLVPIMPELTAHSMYLTKLPTEVVYDTFGVGAAMVELDVLTGELRVLKTHLSFDIGQSYNSIVDVGQLEGAFVMGMGQAILEGLDYDHTTGKCLTDNTWSYKVPIACDIPESFKVELLDMSQKRGQSGKAWRMECMGGIMNCLGLLPWKPSKVKPIYKSAKAIGEPPLLLASVVHSAHHSALLAARGGEALPKHTLPMPAKPFGVLPFLKGSRPGNKI